MNEFDPYLKQIKDGKLLELKRSVKKEFDFKLLMDRTGLSCGEASDLLDFAYRADDIDLSKKLLSYARI